jgi:glycosyltransferase involved in cell wall biosynthesis
MPFFNAEPFIAEGIQSVLAQNYTNWELLLVDDGSTDESTTIARRYASYDPIRIRYLEHADHQNLGASASRNLGLQCAKGRYIAMLDADDVWLPEKLFEQVSRMEATPEADMIYGPTEYWYSWNDNPDDSTRDEIRRPGIRSNRVYPPGSLFSRYFFTQEITTPCTCSLLIRRELIDRAGGFENRFRQVFTDQAFYAKLFLHGSVLVTEGVWDRYRQHPDSSVHQIERRGELGNARLQFLLWLKTYLREQDSSLALRVGVRLAIWAHRSSLAAPLQFALPRLRRRAKALLRRR